jgi:uncharacterized radical SAM superfamily Fe-S cluster-containing enzyme
LQTKQSTRKHVFHDITRSMCPECGQIIDAQVLIRDGALYLRKRCPEHGWHEALVSSDADWNIRAQKYNKPGAIPYGFAASVDRGCPSDCGLCPEHQQHTCIGIVEVTSRCNLACPTCFADAGPGYDLGLGQVEAMLDRLLETEGRPEVVQISGGEPTIHPQIIDILAAAKERDIGDVMLNTNGLRLARDRAFVHELAPYRPIIYLQFDGLEASTYETLRGRDLREIKRQALDHLAEEGLWAVLVATVVRGVNEHEVGDILRFGLQNPAVLGINYQPVTFAGRCAGASPLNRITITDVLHGIEMQTEGLLQTKDFIPVPCPHPDCSAGTYLYVDGEEVVPLTRLINIDDYLDFIANRAAPDLSDEIRQALEGLWSMAAAMGTDKTMGDLTCVACGCGASLPIDDAFLKQHFFMVQVHGFMDEHTLDLKRLMKCCIHELLPDGRAVPFCAYNTLGYRQEVRQQQEGAE